MPGILGHGVSRKAIPAPSLAPPMDKSWYECPQPRGTQTRLASTGPVVGSGIRANQERRWRVRQADGLLPAQRRKAREKAVASA